MEKRKNSIHQFKICWIISPSRCLSFLRILSWRLSKVGGGRETSVLSELTEAEERFFLQNLGGLTQPALSIWSMKPWEDRARTQNRRTELSVIQFNCVTVNLIAIWLKWYWQITTREPTGRSRDGPASLVIWDIWQGACRHGSRRGPGAAHPLWWADLAVHFFLSVMIVLQVIVQQLCFPECFRASRDFTLEFIMVQVYQRLIGSSGVIRLLAVYDWGGRRKFRLNIYMKH